MTRPYHGLTTDPDFRRRVLVLVVRGLCDAEVARREVCHRETVRKVRRAAGLPPNGHESPEYRERVRRRTALQLLRADCATLGALRALVWRLRAAK